MMNWMNATARHKKLWRTVLAIVASILLCGIVLLLPLEVMAPDCSEDQRYDLSVASKQYLQGISQDVELVYYVYGGKLNADRNLYAFLRLIADQSSHIQFRLDNPDLSGANVENHSVEIRVGERVKWLKTSDMIYYDNATLGQMSYEEYEIENQRLALIKAELEEDRTNADLVQIYQAYDALYGADQTTKYNMGDKVVTSAIRNLLAERSPAVYAYGYVNSLFCAQLEQAGYTVTKLGSVQSIPQDCEVLYLGMVSDLTEAEALEVSAYLEQGGKLVLATDYRLSSPTNLSAVLSAYGLSFFDRQNLIYEVGMSQESYSMTISEIFYAGMVPHDVITANVSQVVAYNAHKMVVANADGVTHTALLATPSNTYLMDPATARSTPSEALLDSQTGLFPICILSEKETSAVLWLTMTMSSEANGFSGGGNFTLMKQGFDYLTDFATLDPISGFSDVPIPNTYFTVTNRVETVWIAVFSVVLPSALIVIGLTRKYMRRKRKN